MNTHCCPAAGCVNKIRTSHFMCATHWYRLPMGLRREIKRLWFVIKCHRRAAAVQEAVMLFREVKDRAIDLLARQDSDARKTLAKLAPQQRKLIEPADLKESNPLATLPCETVAQQRNGFA